MKFKLFIRLSIAFALITLPKLSVDGALAENMCDPDFVNQAGNVITVGPTGITDTENIQCAFDLAVANGPGMDVQLQPGTFHIGQIVVNDFYGAFRGSGVRHTLLINLPNLYVTPEDMYLNPPSADNPWPGLFSYIGGDVKISDLAIHVVGDEPTTGWTIWGISPPPTELAYAITFLGTEANADVKRVLIEGEYMQDTLFGYNLINGVFPQGWIGEPPPSLTGEFSIQNSTFRRMASGTPLANVSGAKVVISRNEYEDVTFAMDGGTYLNSYIEFSHNKVNAVTGVNFYDFFAPMDVGSTFLIKNNIFRGEIGIALEQTFGEGNQCLILGNNVQKVNDLGIYLGPGTNRCTVVGGNNKINVLDLGTDNV